MSKKGKIMLQSFAELAPLLLKRMIGGIILTLVLIGLIWYFFLQRPVLHTILGTSVKELTISDISQMPVFLPVPDGVSKFSIGKGDETVTLTPQAQFQITARVAFIKTDSSIMGGSCPASKKAAKIYSRLVPVNSAIVWGGLAQSKNFDALEITEYQRRLKIQVNLLSAAMDTSKIAFPSIIPANKRIAKALDLTERGDFVLLSGYSVSLNGAGFHAQGPKNMDEMNRVPLTLYLTSLTVNGRLFQ